MTKNNITHSRRHTPNRVALIVVIVALLLGIGAVVERHKYDVGLRAVSTDQTTKIFTVERGSSVKEIAKNLEDQHLIRSSWALELYVHSKQLADKFQAGTYALSSSEGTESIVRTLTQGKVATRLVTILPGRRIDQVRADLINSGFSPASVDSALDPSRYSNLPALAFKPDTSSTLEGLLWPDSFQKDATTNPAYIITESLTEMGQHLTPDVQAAFARENLTTYQGLILTSIITQEVSKAADQPQVAQVFLKRLNTGMMLGSDVTARYGSIRAGKGVNLDYDSPYNTLIHTGLPPTPISTVTASALESATHPANTDWLYFVAGDDGTTYFSTNLQDHDALAAKYCHKLCGR